MALCGTLEHEPPCPLAAHHTAAVRDGGQVRLRVLFAAEPDVEGLVRARIDDALAAGEFAVPDGAVSWWRLVEAGPATIAEADAAHAERLRGAPQQ